MNLQKYVFHVFEYKRTELTLQVFPATLKR